MGFNAYIATAARPPELVLRRARVSSVRSTQVIRQVWEVSSAPENLECFSMCWHGFNKPAGKCLP